jgi:GNAT superfamily N-acetyltransferase
MFGGDERFLFGYCVPNDIQNDQVEKDVRHVVAEYDVRVLKIHPSVTGIDLGRREGIDRVEALLDAAGKCGLKTIIHGGMSPDCTDSQSVSYGTINNLQVIDWSITPETVVIAHGGCYGHSPDDACGNIIPGMVKLFQRHDNLSIDTSGVGFDVLCHLLKCFDLERILFGSDALYEKQWVAIVRLWQALQRSVKMHEDALFGIVSINPGKFFGGEVNGNALRKRGEGVHSAKEGPPSVVDENVHRPIRTSAGVGPMKFRLFDHANEDAEKIFSLTEKVRGDSRFFRDRWPWEVLGHPEVGKIQVFVAETGDGELAGMTMRMPCDLRVGGEIRRAFFATNSMVAPAFRGQGIIQQLYGLAAEDGALHLSKGTVMHRLLMKMGYREIVENHYQKTLLAPLSWIRARITGCPPKPGLTEVKQGDSTEFGPVHWFCTEHATLEVSPSITPLLTTNRLNWRYFKVPHCKYIVYEHRRQGRLLSWFVLRIRGAEALLVDLRWASEAVDEPGRTLNFAKGLARRFGAVTMIAWFSHHALRRILAQHFFLKRQETPYFFYFSNDLSWHNVSWQDAYFVHGDNDTEYL